MAAPAHFAAPFPTAASPAGVTSPALTNGGVTGAGAAGHVSAATPLPSNSGSADGAAPEAANGDADALSNFSEEANINLAGATKEEQELHRHRQHIRKLQQLLRSSEVGQAQQRQKIAELQRRLTELERSQKRDQTVNLEYLKNVTVRYIETGETTLVPVMATILQFSPEENERVRKRTAKGGLLSNLLPFG